MYKVLVYINKKFSHVASREHLSEAIYYIVNNVMNLNCPDAFNHMMFYPMVSMYEEKLRFKRMYLHTPYSDFILIMKGKGDLDEMLVRALVKKELATYGYNQ